MKMKNFILYFSFFLFFLVGCKQTDSNAQNRTDNQQEKRTNKGITPNWGSRYYKVHNGKMEALEHIWLRHNYNSTYDRVSKFSKTYGTRIAIKALITEALQKASGNDIRMEANGQKTVTVTMDKLTGTSLKGKLTYKIRIHLDEKDFVETAYPY
jgi:asparagine N-glycosylation enzyme membrane subunit Stt3